MPQQRRDVLGSRPRGSDQARIRPQRQPPGPRVPERRDEDWHDSHHDEMSLTISWLAEIPSGKTDCDDRRSRDGSAWNTRRSTTAPRSAASRSRDWRSRSTATRTSASATSSAGRTPPTGAASPSDASHAVPRRLQLPLDHRSSLDDFSRDLLNHSSTTGSGCRRRSRTKLLERVPGPVGHDLHRRPRPRPDLRRREDDRRRWLRLRPGGQRPAGHHGPRCSRHAELGTAAHVITYGANNLVASYTTASDGFYFIWQKTGDNTRSRVARTPRERLQVLHRPVRLHGAPGAERPCRSPSSTGRRAR